MATSLRIYDIMFKVQRVTVRQGSTDFVTMTFTLKTPNLRLMQVAQTGLEAFPSTLIENVTSRS